MYFHLYKGIFGICLNPTTIKKSPANKILKLPNWIELTPCKPNCIKMKELPQTQPKKASKYHFNELFSIPIFFECKIQPLFSQNH